jgi:hypothetical protein
MKLIRVGAVFALMVLAGTATAAGSVWDKAREEHSGSKEITVYRSPSCGCCSGWIEHLRTHDFEVVDVKTDDMNSVKAKLGVPGHVASCHTATIDGYVIEGHVPADDIKRLLKLRPKIDGLAVPQMPTGSPGMEMGERKDPFVVVQFKKSGEFDSFNEYWSY